MLLTVIFKVRNSSQTSISKSHNRSRLFSSKMILIPKCLLQSPCVEINMKILVQLWKYKEDRLVGPRSKKSRSRKSPGNVIARLIKAVWPTKICAKRRATTPSTMTPKTPFVSKNWTKLASENANFTKTSTVVTQSQKPNQTKAPGTEASMPSLNSIPSKKTSSLLVLRLFNSWIRSSV